MKYSRLTTGQDKMILFNDHYVARSYDCTDLTALAVDGVIPAGTIIPSNDANAKGVLLSSVKIADNPNGIMIIHGFVNKAKIPALPTDEAIVALLGRGVQFMDETETPVITDYSVTYDLNGATGTDVIDSNSPYAYGSTVTVLPAPTITVYPTGTTQFDKWNTQPDGSGTAFDPSDEFTITEDTVLYATYKA